MIKIILSIETLEWSIYRGNTRRVISN